MGVIIRPLSQNELTAHCSVVLDTFDEFVAPHYSTEGIETIHASTPRQSAEGFESGDIFLAGVENGEFAAVLRLSEAGHLHHLFVLRQYQGQGLGKRLLLEAVRELCRRDLGVDNVTVNASPNAIEVYRGWGFEEVGPEYVDSGVRATPMQAPVGNFV